MTFDLPSGLEGLRRPEYTGENRCVPCTAVNVAIALVLAAVTTVVALPAAPVVLGVSLAAIYLRGYLVPGTPTLTKRYLPERVRALFDNGPATGEIDLEVDAGAPDPAADGTDPEQVLLEHGIVETCARPAANGSTEEDLCLAEDVETAWRAAIETVREGDRERQVATFLEADPGAVAINRTGDRAIVRVDGRLAARWESEASLIGDLAGVQALSDRLDDWTERPLRERSRLASALRAFVERCPACDGPVSVDATTVESCCRAADVYAITCEDCGARVLEVPR